MKEIKLLWKVIRDKWDAFWIGDEYDRIAQTFGYDEVSQTSIYMLKHPGRKERTVEIKRGNGIVSLHRMKKLFCEDCIKKALKAVEGQEMGELVIYDMEKSIFHSIKNGNEIKAGDYMLETECKNDNYNIKINVFRTSSR